MLKFRDSDIKLSQARYIEKLFRNFDYFDCKLVSTHFDPYDDLVKNDRDSLLDHVSVICSLVCYQLYSA